MKKLLLGLTVLASAATASAYPVCISLAPYGYCDAMQFNGRKSAAWDWCGEALHAQTTALYKKRKAATTCISAEGCVPAITYGYDAVNWSINLKASTVTVTAFLDGVEEIFLENAPVSITEGECTPTEGGRSVLAR